MFQSLNIFKAPALPVGEPDAAAPRSDLPKSDPASSGAGMPQKGTATDLKSVRGPSREELEADFAFMTDVLAKAGPASVAPVELIANPATRVLAQEKTRVLQQQRDPQKTRVLTTTVPVHIPHHKRKTRVSGDAPVFAVQSAPRPAQPDFLRNSLAEETDQKPLTSGEAHAVEDLWGFQQEPDTVGEGATEMPISTSPIIEHSLFDPENVEPVAPATATPATVTEPAEPDAPVVQADSQAAIEDVDVDDMADVLATMMREAHFEPEEEPSAATKAVFGDMRRVWSSKSPDGVSDATKDPFNFGPELPKLLRRLLNLLPMPSTMQDTPQTV